MFIECSCKQINVSSELKQDVSDKSRTAAYEVTILGGN